MQTRYVIDQGVDMVPLPAEHWETVMLDGDGKETQNVADATAIELRLVGRMQGILTSVTD